MRTHKRDQFEYCISIVKVGENGCEKVFVGDVCLLEPKIRSISRNSEIMYRDEYA